MDNNSWFIKPLGDRWEKLNAWDVIKYIDQTLNDHYIPLTNEQKFYLRHDWYVNNDMPFLAYSWNAKEKAKNNILWRLSIIFFIPWFVILLLFIPFKWIFTGSSLYHINPKKKSIASLTIKWYQKCFNVQ